MSLALVCAGVAFVWLCPVLAVVLDRVMPEASPLPKPFYDIPAIKPMSRPMARGRES